MLFDLYNETLIRCFSPGLLGKVAVKYLKKGKKFSLSIRLNFGLNFSINLNIDYSFPVEGFILSNSLTSKTPEVRNWVSLV